MGLIQWATSPWGREVPIHIAFGLVWVAIICGVLFLIAHAIYIAYWPKPPEAASGATWPTMNPRVAPLNRPSVISATLSDNPAPTIAPVTPSISRIPGPPRGPS